VADSAAIRDFSCSVCGAPVGSREVYPPGIPRAVGRGGEHPGRRLDRCWQYTTDRDRTRDREVTPEEFARAVEALGGEQAGSCLALYCRHESAYGGPHALEES
jgi:hypothetical protein